MNESTVIFMAYLPGVLEAFVAIALVPLLALAILKSPGNRTEGQE